MLRRFVYMQKKTNWLKKDLQGLFFDLALVYYIK